MEYVALGVGILLLVAVFAPSLAWAIRYPFLVTNWLQWFLMAPPFFLLRNHQALWPRIGFLALSPLGIAYWIVAYVVLAPLRLLNAVYFNLVLFYSVTLRDGLADVALPSYSTYSKLKYILKWFGFLPWRIVRMLGKYVVSILQGIAMTVFDVLWPTLTMFHGTTLEDAAWDIARSGVWWVGTGNYAGTGIYFSIKQAVAEHYSEQVIRQEIANKIMVRLLGTPAVIVARVTHEPCRPVATLPEALRLMVGYNGDIISQGLAFPWVALQHWREDLKWFEFCLVQADANTRLNTWRVRPICVVKTKERSPIRVEGGLAVWPGNARGWIVLGTTMAIVIALLLPTSGIGGSIVGAVGDKIDEALPFLGPTSVAIPDRTETPRPATKIPTQVMPGEFCPFEPGDQVKLDKKANVWAEPRVKDSAGKEYPVDSLPQGAKVYLVTGPKRGYINWNKDVKGYWWKISLTKGDSAIGWIWENTLHGCDWDGTKSK